MTALFSDPSKFKKLDKDPSLTQLASLQNYLRQIHKRNEIDDATYNAIRPQSTKPARAHGLPKTHKSFDNLPTFRPIIDTMGTAYKPLAKYLSTLLNPLTHNEFKLQDSFDAVVRIHNIPSHLFTEGFRFVSFDVTSLFTNIPLRKTVNFILKRVYKDKCITTSLNKRSLKKLLLDACTKTPFSFNDQLYQQTDGICIGSPLGPTLADILMTAFEEEIFKTLISSNIIKFYLLRPVSASIVREIIDKYASAQSNLKELRTAAFCTLGFAGFLRFDELRTMNRNQIHLHDEYMEIILPKSKKDVYREGNVIYIARSKTKYCPVRLLLRYMGAANIDCENDLPLFRQLAFHKNNNTYTLRTSSLSYTSCREMFKDALKSLGYNPKEYGLHSLRSGGITEVVQNSNNTISERLLKLHGRWKTDRAKDMYVQESISNRLKVTRSLSL